jgi:hypothetical protein
MSYLIRLVECTSYSHVYLSWQSSSGPEIAYEAAGSKIRFLNKEIFDKQAETLHTFTYELSRDEYRQLIKFCMTNVGIDYGNLQIVGMALVRIFNLKKNPFSDGRASQVCSETVAYFLQDILKKEIDFPVEIAGPKHLYNYLIKDKQEK